MKSKIIVAIAVLLFACAGAFAQNGGKAEPLRIKFGKGKSSATVSNRIKTDQQHEFIFSAKEGQLINVKIVSVPRAEPAAFVILSPTEEAKRFTELFENYEYTFPAPHTGDYVIHVFLPPPDLEMKMKSARYNLTLTITKPKL